MLKMVTLECPKCGASLNADDTRIHCFHMEIILLHCIMLCEKTPLLFKY